MRYKSFKILFIFIVTGICYSANAQHDSAYSIIVAGHAYGAHSGTNIGLHPPFLDKLSQNVDSTTEYIFLTGDIVNHSNSESWQQVENELTLIGVNSCYVMGNHDDNSVGYLVFEQKHGGIFYSFTSRNELYIVLNSTESDRSISSAQLSFMDDILKNAVTLQKKVFIFFHEVIWNSSEKYQLVRSNSRSRYDQMKDHSNFWDEVYPMLSEYTDKEFYLFAGDVGGNPDAIAASYDKWGNVTLLSSGMGEVADENYMKVDILPDTVEFTLVALNDDVEMHTIDWYNVPEAPSNIIGPNTIIVPKNQIEYSVDPVFNATSYEWDFSEGINGQSDTSSILLDFDTSFESGEILVTALNDGFGESEPAVLEIMGEKETSVSDDGINFDFSIQQTMETIQIVCRSEKSEKAYLRIYNSVGSLLLADEFRLNQGLNTRDIIKSKLLAGILIIELTAGDERFIQKVVL